MDKNGYNDSLFNTADGTCFLTGKVCATARHEIFNKDARKASKEDGLWIAVCPEIHDRIHNDYILWDRLKRDAEIKWLVADFNRSIGDFVERFGRNYL